VYLTYILLVSNFQPLSTPRRALSDITNQLSPIRPSLPPRRLLSLPSTRNQRSQFSRLEPIQRMACAVLTQIGIPPKAAAPLIGTTIKSVRKWNEAFDDNGDVEDDYREGRPQKLHIVTQDAIIAAAVDAPKSSTPRQLKHLFNLSCSAKTVRRCLDDAGLFGRIAKKLPLLTDAAIHKRTSFAEGYSRMDWTKVLWSDEMSIRLGPQGQTWVQRPIGEAFTREYALSTVKHPPKIHVWGCFASGGVGRIHVFKENLDAKLYKEILKEHLMKSAHVFWPNGIWHFQQDNDPKHTSKVVSEYLEINLCIKDYLIKWPPYSPDLNPIENLWADLKKRVEKHNCKNVGELEKAVNLEWIQTDKVYCKKLVDSMPKRLQQVLEACGGATQY
jgi:transposase